MLPLNQNIKKMAYKKSDMLYDDGKYYKWTAKGDHDNPFVKGGKERDELNRTEGYEVLYFIQIMDKNNFKGNGNTASLQKVEKMIRHDVPKTTHNRAAIVSWIVANWSNVTP